MNGHTEQRRKRRTAPVSSSASCETGLLAEDLAIDVGRLHAADLLGGLAGLLAQVVREFFAGTLHPLG